MPNVTLYIRKEDWDKWQAIEDKPKWLQMALEGTNIPRVNKAIEERKKIEQVMDKAKAFQALKQQFGTAEEPHYEPTEE